MSYRDEIAESLANRRLVLFTGAGISRDAGLPDWYGLGSGLKTKLVEKGQLRVEYVEPIESLLKRRQVSAAIELMLSDVPRKNIVAILRTLLTPSSQSHVCSIIGKMKTRGVITTNYDRVLDACLPPNLYRLNNSLAKLALVPTAVASDYMFLLKLHGDIDDELDPTDPLVGEGSGFMILSRGDYAAAVQGQRRNALTSALLTVLSQCSVLFLGYSFSDPDIDLVMRFLKNIAGSPIVLGMLH